MKIFNDISLAISGAGPMVVLRLSEFIAVLIRYRYFLPGFYIRSQGPLNECHVIFQFAELDGSIKKIRNIFFILSCSCSVIGDLTRWQISLYFKQNIKCQNQTPERFDFFEFIKN